MLIHFDSLVRMRNSNISQNIRNLAGLPKAMGEMRWIINELPYVLDLPPDPSRAVQSTLENPYQKQRVYLSANISTPPLTTSPTPRQQSQCLCLDTSRLSQEC